MNRNEYTPVIVYTGRRLILDYPMRAEGKGLKVRYSLNSESVKN